MYAEDDEQRVVDVVERVEDVKLGARGWEGNGGGGGVDGGECAIEGVCDEAGRSLPTVTSKSHHIFAQTTTTYSLPRTAHFTINTSTNLVST